MNNILGKFAVVLGVLLLGNIYNSFAQSKENYHFSIDLTKVENDELTVNLIPPKTKEKSIIYNIPKIVPGTYSISDFGRFISDFKARDKKGKAIEVERLDYNRWKINNPKKVASITYKVADTWDTNKDNVIFEPAGTNIEDKENFVINTHGFFGYFDGLKSNSYELTFIKPEGFYGSTSLISNTSDSEKDVFIVESYMDLADAPIMYNTPDTTTINMGDAEVLISVFSPNNKLTSQYVAENIAEILEAQRKYLGGKLPIEKYAFIIYLTDKPSLSGMMGALEHSYSSLYFLPELAPQYITQSIRDIAAHEFFHIVTPLNIHSEEIHDFNYIAPEMSKHLWLYEGVTEYSSGHVQVQYELISFDDYLGILNEKLNAASAYNRTLPFTEMSEKCLDEYADQYGNVYEKGALIGLCLDITFRDLSDGEYGLQDMMQNLSESYGKNKPFKDEALFDRIAELSGYPEILDFFDKYVEGSELLPFKEVFEKVGIKYNDSTVVKDVTMGNILRSLIIDQDSNIVISDVSDLDAFGEKMGYKSGDIIRKINNDTITLATAVDVIGTIRNNAQAGDTLSVSVERVIESDDESESKPELIDLIGTMEVTERMEYNTFEPDPAMTERQRKLLNSWLIPKE